MTNEDNTSPSKMTMLTWHKQAFNKLKWLPGYDNGMHTNTLESLSGVYIGKFCISIINLYESNFPNTICTDTTHFLLQIGILCYEVDLITVNCEGCEFEIKEEVIASGMIKQFRHVQFATHPTL